MNFSVIAGYNLAPIRKCQNYTQKQLADLSGVSRSTISNIETGRTNPTVDTIKILCDALNIHPSMLFINNLFVASGNRKKDKKAVPLNTKVWDSGVFECDDSGMNMYFVSESDLKLIMYFVNNPNIIKELSKYSIV